ncbi:MAG TPA: hypothetical protein VFW98_13500 [Gemmatimonadaceae bacterium]|nr:hypothetical protein [Gemmatimonadaceae bacterium]
MRTRFGRMRFAVSMLALALPAVGHAQHETYRHLCETGAAVVVHLNPDATGARAARNHEECLREAAALVAGMRTHAHDTDLAELEAFWREADQWHDATVMAAASQLATDASAASPARVFAVRYLLTLLRPSMVYSYTRLIREDSSYWVRDTIKPFDGNDTAAIYLVDGKLVRAGMIDSSEVTIIYSCADEGQSDWPDTYGTPLPTDYVARTQQTLQTIATSPAMPRPVRRAAQCRKGGMRVP